MQLILDVPDNNLQAVMTFLEGLKPFEVVIKEKKRKKENKEIEMQKASLRQAFAELKLYKEGKIQFKSWDQLLKELEEDGL